MKKLTTVFLCALPFLGIAQGRYTLNGQIADSTSSDVVYVRYKINSMMVMDSTRLKNGKFTLCGNLPGVTTGYLSMEHKNRSSDQMEIYLEPKVMTIKSPTKLIKNGVVAGSPINDLNKEYLAILAPVTLRNSELMSEWRSKIKAGNADSAYIRSFNQQNLALYKERQLINRNFYLAHLDSYLGLIAFYGSGNYDIEGNLEHTASEFGKFSKAVKATDLGENINGVIQGAFKTKIGLKAMDFTQNDVNGKPVKLSDFKGKYVLLDFWASWCTPCRAENPVLVKAYADYKDRNFTILSVSLDQPGKKQAWVDAIKKDGMSWTNVSDLKYWRNEVAVMYGINSVPANFLIAPDGKIVARDLRGGDLDKKLSALLM